MTNDSFFAASLARAFSTRRSLSAAKPTQNGGRRQRGHFRQDVGVGHESDRHRLGRDRLFHLGCTGLLGPPVGHGCHGDKYVGNAGLRHHRLVHLARRDHVEAPHAARRRQPGRAADQRHLGAGLARRAGDRVAHLARRAVRDSAHRIDRLERRPGRDQHAPALQAFELETRRSRPRRSRAAPGRRPLPTSPQAWSPTPGPRITAPSDSMARTLRSVAGCSHISTFIAGATSNRHRSRGRASASVDSRSSHRRGPASR